MLPNEHRHVPDIGGRGNLPSSTLNSVEWYERRRALKLVEKRFVFSSCDAYPRPLRATSKRAVTSALTAGARPWLRHEKPSAGATPDAGPALTPPSRRVCPGLERQGHQKKSISGSQMKFRKLVALSLMT